MKTEDLVAFKGYVTLEKAVWDTDWGMYVVLQIDQSPQEKDHANPFKRFTKMRKGKVGTRFDAVFVNDDDSFVYEDEVMLKGWSDGTTGWKVSLWLSATHDGLHPFMTHEKGERYAMVTIELDDDEVPINQKKRERLSRAEARKKYPLAMLAGQLSNSESFREYVAERVGRKQDTHVAPDVAANYIRQVCVIDSRKELDSSLEAGERFHDKVRKPFLVWQGERA